MGSSALDAIAKKATSVRKWFKRVIRRLRHRESGHQRRLLRLRLKPGVGQQSALMEMDEAVVSSRTGHITVMVPDNLGQVIDGCVLVWGGYSEATRYQRYWPPEQVIVGDSSSGVTRFMAKNTLGEIPPPTSGAAAAILGTKLYVFGGFTFRDVYNEEEDSFLRVEENVNTLYELDLISFTWRKVEPSGTPPLSCDKMTAWASDEKLYIFGGFGVPPMPQDDLPVTFIRGESNEIRGWNNQLVAFNAQTICWEWPQCRGRAPSPRAAHAALARGSDVFVFGGRVGSKRLNDLYHLDTTRMVWTRLQGAQDDPGVPIGRSWHSLTFLDEDKALLFGGYDLNGHPRGDCWLLRLSPTSASCPSSSRWTRLSHLESDNVQRLWHTAVKDSASGQVLVVGGVVNDLLDRDVRTAHPTSVMRLRVAPPKLLFLAFDAVLANAGRLANQLPDLPKTLYENIQHRLSHANVK